MKKSMSIEKIENRIFQIRGKKVMLDTDLAGLYEVTTKRLNKQVKRNKRRFPEDFIFQLTKNERNELVANCDRLERLKYASSFPYAFTEQGVAMLSSALNSKRAIMVNIQIMRAFVKLRRMTLTYAGLKHKVDAMEKKYDRQFQIVFKAIKKLLEPTPVSKKRLIGF